MTPWEQVCHKYEVDGGGRNLSHDLSWHLINGYVINGPKLFVMARPVDIGSPHATAINTRFLPDDCNAWHVHVIAGSIPYALTLFPFPLPFVSWEGRNGLVVIPVKRIHRLTNLFQPSGNPL